MKSKQIILSIFLFLSLTTLSFGQNNDLKIFGYFQNNFTHFGVYRNGVQSLNVNSFLSQQMNVFFQNNINTEFSAFVNLEFTNSFSSKDDIGGFKIEEAWAKYSPTTLLNIKGGVLIPRFNNFNEIKNRTVLLPYIYRPFAYETYFFNQFGTGEFVPTSANIQAYGDIPVGDLYLNYTAFYGNSETKMLNTNKSLFGPGQDVTPYKLVGGRVGVEYGDLQLGASMTYDHKNLDSLSNGRTYIKYKISNVTRTRLGAYLNYSFAGFEFEGELIKVYYDLSDKQKTILASNPTFPNSFDKSFYHANLLYNITEKLGAYAGYDYLKGQDNVYIASGLKIYDIGLSYKANDAVILKGQYVYQKFVMPNPTTGIPYNGTRKDILVGASVSF